MTILKLFGMRGFIVRVLVLSGFLGLLQLSTSLYMLLVYDRVLPSGHLGSLLGLTALTAALHAAFAGLDVLRARMVCRAALRFFEDLERDLFRAFETRRGSALPMLDDGERVRRFLSSAGPCAAFDLLWLPAFLAATFLLHPVLGFFACAGVALLIGATVLAERRMRIAGHHLNQARHTRYVLAWDLHGGRAGAERRGRWHDTVQCWDALSRRYAETTLRTAESAHVLQALGKGLRLFLQSAGLGIGAVLALEGVLTTGGLIASSLILARTFACLDGALLHWAAFVAAWESFQRLVTIGKPRSVAYGAGSAVRAMP